MAMALPLEGRRRPWDMNLPGSAAGDFAHVLDTGVSWALSTRTASPSPVPPIGSFLSEKLRDAYERVATGNTFEAEVFNASNPLYEDLADWETAYQRTANWRTMAMPLPATNSLVIQQLERLKSLESGWDGYAAEAIDGSTILAAQLFVANLEDELPAMPKVVPMTRGRLQLEWHSGPRSLELEFESPSQVHYLKWDSSVNVEEEDLVPAVDRSKLLELIQWFAARA